ncbi:MAG TPA: hypothetical protein DDW52_30335 [Planctomycetaceae bacterium]|nr:hypothetical protein [Planctomycetaceae bacterium]
MSAKTKVSGYLLAGHLLRAEEGTPNGQLYSQLRRRCSDPAFALRLGQSVALGTTASKLFHELFGLGVGRYRRFCVACPGFAGMTDIQQQGALMSLARIVMQVSPPKAGKVEP